MPQKKYDIGSAFERVENELINSMLRNMKRHRVQELEEGFEWSMWQAEQLKGLEQYRRQNQKKFGKKFTSINRKIDEVIRQARGQGGLDQEREILEAIRNGFTGYKKAGTALQASFFRANSRKLDALVKATTEDMQKAETAILRMANDQYRKIIFNAQIYASSGAGTYEQAVDMATKDFLGSGLNCIEYANGARRTIADYADMALKTASKRAYLTGEGEKRQEWGISTVILAKRGAPCPKCLPFSGKILIDDVWSGGDPSDGPYPLMSSAIRAGLYHPRCKDHHTTFFSGVTTEPAPISRKEVEEKEERFKQEQKKIYQKRQAAKYKRLADGMLDPDQKEKYKNKYRQWAGLAAGRGIITPVTPPKFVERIDVSTAGLIESKLKEYEDLIRNEAEEHAYVILGSGKVYHFKGGKNGVNPKALGGALKGAVLTHNHPLKSGNEYSFSGEDLQLFEECELKRLQGTDERFTYVLDKESKRLDDPIPLVDMDASGMDFRHNQMIEEARLMGIGYWREPNAN